MTTTMAADSGASKWTAARRETYVDDLDSERSLIAVSLGSNRSKGGQDPAERLSPAEDALCPYAPTGLLPTPLKP
jgi:hypothetical protein